ncbi:hypothetical protein [Streptomyces beihaiensis]|uniref:Uncharacterized protein n=1 Tax=Streptomyces beihaiensis TaxID=2984495 RepID=A0ABT3U2N5_9ACTN|nr:hypothetical protein [Streptomyces beihaiensis]MCX3063566.1 hypothetical protein [Streptomyces beihaiensis]
MWGFHQDWACEADTAAELMRQRLVGASDENVLAARRDLQSLCELPTKTLEVLWEAGTEYLPTFNFLGGGAQWTRTVLDLCDASLSERTDVRPLAGADIEEGSDRLDAILAEIQEARRLDTDVQAALAECARRCTPELAFRLLLRAMVAGDLELTPEQYARLEAIGEALEYGEFVVDNARYLSEQ